MGKRIQADQCEFRVEWVPCPPEHAAEYWAGWRVILATLAELARKNEEDGASKFEHEERIAEI
jgi:hypothetical protein